MIIGGVKEELSLQQIMTSVEPEVKCEFAGDKKEVSTEEIVAKVYEKLKAEGLSDISLHTSIVKKYINCY